MAIDASVERTAGPPPVFAGGRTPTLAELADAPLKSRPRPGTVDVPLTELKGVGSKLAGLAGELLDLRTLDDLVWHLPHGYRDRSVRVPVRDLSDGAEATVRVEVRTINRKQTRRRRFSIVEATVFDESGAVQAVWFNQPWLVQKLAPGTKVQLHGTMENGKFKVAAHETVDRAGEGGDRPVAETLHTGALVPLHPATERLKPERIREWVAAALALAGDEGDPLPAATRIAHGLGLRRDALVEVHFPRSTHLAEEARLRLALEELMLHQIALAGNRRANRQARRAPTFEPPGELTARWRDSLPFTPTGDQMNACRTIDDDIAAGGAMQRLLMGEVGSGKTMVALNAMLRGVESGFQAALLAPTETLAEQHATTVAKLLEPLEGEVTVALLTGSTPKSARNQILARLASGEIDLLVGTHALLEPDVEIRALGLAVIDEQHRFGVRQRTQLEGKGPASREGTGRLRPHMLHMTATPIPRTLALTAYGDLDTTTLRELPKGRLPVTTRVVDNPDGREDAYRLAREEIAAGRQVFVVCPLVEQSENLEARVATEEAQRLSETEFAGHRIGLLHGQMKPAEKSAAMKRFAAGECDVLVATTVIEVGVDVPNATVMIVENAERYGISQLHQLRGRIGRGGHQSHCLLLTESVSHGAKVRLGALAAGHDGFRLAEIDLELRGEGEILGVRQSGAARFRAARLPEDAALLEQARQELLRIGKGGGALSPEELDPLRNAAASRFGTRGIAA